MQKILITLCFVFAFVANGIGFIACAEENYLPQNGDIIFHTSQSSQSDMIQIATESPYSHVGIVYIRDGKPYVYEAIKTMSLTPLDTWVARGIGKKYTVLRPKEELSTETLVEMRKVGEKYKNVSYDILFQWSDDKMYCSELVWKVYEQGAHIRLVEPKTFSSYKFDDPKIAEAVKKRWGKNLRPEELVVAPSDLFASPYLVEVYSNYE